jgi:putative peptidoglycan lipid II flippase
VNLLRAASTVSSLTLLSRITGLVRDQLMAAAFGASAAADAFHVAFRIPNLFRRLFAEGAFSQAFVPLLARVRETEGDGATRLLVDAVATVLFWVLLFTCAAGVIVAPVLVWLLASGLRAFDTATLLTRWMFPYIGFMSLVALSAGVLNTWRHFAVPAFTPVLLNLAMIAAAGAGAGWFERQGLEPILVMAAGVMAGGLLQLAWQVPALARIGMLPRLAIAPGAVRRATLHPGVRRIFLLMGPAVLGVSVSQLSLLINTQIASHVAVGAVTWLVYADRLMEFPTALLGVALGVVLTPQLSAAQGRADGQRYSSLLDWGLRMVVMLSLPCAVALLVFGEPLVAVLFHYGQFSASDVGKTVLALHGNGIGLLGIIAVKVLAPGYYAQQDTKTPMKIGLLVLLLTQGLNLAFVPWLGHAGLTLSIGVAALLNASLLLAGLLRSGAYRPEPGWMWFVVKVFLGCALVGGILWTGAQALDWTGAQLGAVPRAGALTMMLAVAAAAYFAALAAMRLDLRQFLRQR